jgi:DNA-binding GntR family transcriptional regulator
LWHAAGGPNHNVEISLSSLAVETGLSKSSVQAALRRLTKRGLVTSRRTSPTAVPLYLVHSPWRGR